MLSVGTLSPNWQTKGTKPPAGLSMPSRVPALSGPHSLFPVTRRGSYSPTCPADEDRPPFALGGWSHYFPRSQGWQFTQSHPTIPSGSKHSGAPTVCRAWPRDKEGASPEL